MLKRSVFKDEVSLHVHVHVHIHIYTCTCIYLVCTIYSVLVQYVHVCTCMYVCVCRVSSKARYARYLTRFNPRQEATPIINYSVYIV